MTAKITCKAKAETGIFTFEYQYAGPNPRVVTFEVHETVLERWWKGVTTIQEIMETPFKTGPGMFDRPVISFSLYSLVMQIGGDEELVGAELVVTATKKQDNPG